MFGIGTNTEKPDQGKLTGEFRSVACGCWFTSKGRSFPKMVKYEDEEGCIQTIQDIEVVHSEKKYYCGIPMMSYVCRTVIGEMEYYFTLLYHVEESQWKLLWK